MVQLRRWTDDDFTLLEQCNAAEMTAYLGGPESPEALRTRQRRYVDNKGPGGMFVIVLDDGDVAGSIGYWEHSEDASAVWESGWAVLPAHQGRGIATEAIRAVTALASSERTHPTLHAYPAVENAASNALCRKAGFTLIGPRRVEYPKGHWMVCNDWTISLPG